MGEFDQAVQIEEGFPGIAKSLETATLTVDGNNPLCGREVIFTLEIVTVRDATEDEMQAGGAIPTGPDIDPSRLRPT